MMENIIYFALTELSALKFARKFFHKSYVTNKICDCGETKAVICFDTENDFLKNVNSQVIIICEACYGFYKDKRI